MLRICVLTYIHQNLHILHSTTNGIAPTNLPENLCKTEYQTTWKAFKN